MATATATTVQQKPIDTVLDPEYIPNTDLETPAHIPGYMHTLQNILTPQECEDICEIAEATGFAAASLYTDGTGREHFSENRKSSRCILDSHMFAERLWRRLGPFMPATWGSATCVGLNERLRILRYDPGDEFKPHSDGSYSAPGGAISKITVLLYLNAGYEGGFTHFLHEDGTTWVPIEPHVGSAAVQDQALVHGVPPLIRGRKYAIRTEVMYQPVVTVGPYKEVKVYE
jgi:hypothetical protein